ncbi:MAG: NADP-dependent oxidoreductase [Actinomycetota bacterium]
MTGTEHGIEPTMWAIRLHAPGGPSELVLERIETPQPGPGEALVRVHAAAITPDELGWPTDRLPATPSYELSGEVAVVAPDVDTVAVGEPVWALAAFDRDGAAAEYIVVPAALLAPKPRTLDHEGSAAVPLSALSAWQGLFDHGGLGEGGRVLIHGAAGGVGHFATQLARGRGSYVVGTTSAASVERARSFGAHEVLDPASVRFEDSLEPVDLVFDTVGGELLERSLAIIRPGGRLVSVAEEPPEIAPERKIETTYFVVEPNRAQLVALAAMIDAGDLRPAIDSVFPLSDAVAAFERSMASGKRGKVILRVVGGIPDDQAS